MRLPAVRDWKQSYYCLNSNMHVHTGVKAQHAWKFMHRRIFADIEVQGNGYSGEEAQTTLSCTPKAICGVQLCTPPLRCLLVALLYKSLHISFARPT